MKHRPTVFDFLQDKKNNKKISILTAYDALTAQLLERAGIHIILVGDSLGNMFSGYENTLPVTQENMIYHTQAVSRGAKESFIISDMPFLSYQISAEQARLNAGRLIKEGGAQAVKMEIHNKEGIGLVKAVIDMGIPVMGHIGFTPQSVYALGGYKVQGKTQVEEDKFIALAIDLEKAGCFSILMEMVPSGLAKKIAETISIPAIGIGAGPNCDGQVLVTQDLLGLNPNFTPKFVKKYADLGGAAAKAVEAFIKDVETGGFPDQSHTF
ncbi:3-methyl-2-oxobutanoate hydroxymethyltransferase [Thermoproteota archaeon]